MIRERAARCLFILGCLGLAVPALAEPTRVTVRVLSKDAKFIGTSMGGAQITIRDADTGELLARGVTRGSTGDTGLIMRQDRKRGAGIATGDAAAFTAVLDLDRPRRIEIAARGPLAQPQAAGEASTTQWIVPGRHLDGGDGVLLDMPGFALDVLAPPAHSRMGTAPARVTIRANLTMMCGCPVEPGGLWDAERFEVRALLFRDGDPAGEAPLAYAGVVSQFEGTVVADRPGAWEAIVFAHDPSNGNTGVDRVTFLVSE